MVVNCAEFHPEQYFESVPLLKNRRGNPSGNKRHYIGLTTAFDIETTVLEEHEQSFMYIWQWQFGEDYTVIGRTWDEFLDLQRRVKDSLPSDRWLCVYVHNLSYEFQFLKGVYSFMPSDIFALDSRKILKCDMWGVFELRCSYRLTNMNLSDFTKKMKVKHQKLSGDEYDYSQKRYPWTQLSDRELEYCTNDVLGLVEAINALMARDGDTLQTIPLTSTGYVRRNAKRAMRQGNTHHAFVGSILPDWEQYKALREAFRGGNTHANRYYSCDIIEYVHSADESSAYPYVLCNCEFPMTAFVPIDKSDLNPDYISRCMTVRHKALLLRVGIKNLRLRDPFWGCPYISKDKSRNIHKAVEAEDIGDNGRILSAEYLELTITDLDLRIILEEYEGEMIFLQGWYSSYKKLPEELVKEVIKYYKDKTELKGVKGQEVYYDKSKALLNALYGMMAQDPVKYEQIFRQIGDFDTPLTQIMNDQTLTDEEKKEKAEELGKSVLEKSNRRAFLAYQWGVWTTAHSRYCLEKGLRIIHETKGAEFIYCDTDSLKYTGSVDWSRYNTDRVAECMVSGSHATDPKGVEHYMGVFESEDNKETGYAYRYFKTMGAKKYAYVEKEGEGVHCTIAGVNKKKGGKELDKNGGLEAFKEGFVFKDAGGTMAVYNDNPEIKELEIDGHILPITSNVAILPSEYTLGITGEYERIIKFGKNYLANPYVI